MTPREERLQRIVDVAVDWREPEHPPRTEAMNATQQAPNRWTEEALEYALNRWMQQVTVEALGQWLGEIPDDDEWTVGVVHGSSDPMEGFREALAVWASGHSYLGCVPDASPAILLTFADELSDTWSGEDVTFTGRDEVLRQADAVMAQPERDEIDAFHDECAAHDIPEGRRFLSPQRVSIGVLDGHEGDDVRDRLAEDLLLYEGGGHRRLAILWAPRDLSPDAYLQSMARFRGAFPVHPDTPGALQMQKAFLEANDEPRAYAEGLEFLVSRGRPEPQVPGHIRWTEYDDWDEVGDWLQSHRDEVGAVVAREGLHDQLPESWPLRTPGGLHVPPLDDAEGREIATFVRSLG